LVPSSMDLAFVLTSNELPFNSPDSQCEKHQGQDSF
jgi:hypothetical protein